VLLPVGHVAAAQEAKFWEHFGKSKEVPELPR
jgi:hypothetical protein